jgi:hypothetical protein
MIEQELIDKINQASHLGEVLALSDWKKQYNEMARLLHPDLCHIPGAAAAFARLNALKEGWEKGYRFSDEAGAVRAHNQTVTFVGDPKLLLQSYRNYGYLKRLRHPAAKHFHRYLPESMTLDGAAMTLTLCHRAAPLTGLTLPQGHANWILSRLLEFTAWLAQEGWTHGGINPESVFVAPETHGIILTSFYHLTPRSETVHTISAKYKHWYPNALFVNKKAEPQIDIELSKRTIATLLGDPSGAGIKLQKTHHRAFAGFLLTVHTDAFACYDQYRNLLDKHFPKKFLPLNL